MVFQLSAHCLPSAQTFGPSSAKGRELELHANTAILQQDLARTLWHSRVTTAERSLSRRRASKASAWQPPSQTRRSAAQHVSTIKAAISKPWPFDGKYNHGEWRKESACTLSGVPLEASIDWHLDESPLGDWPSQDSPGDASSSSLSNRSLSRNVLLCCNTSTE